MTTAANASGNAKNTTGVMMAIAKMRLVSKWRLKVWFSIPMWPHSCSSQRVRNSFVLNGENGTMMYEALMPY